jgi:hypothetical protein
MDRDVARHVLRVSFRASRELGNLVPLLKEELPAAEYEPLAKGIASAVAEVGFAVMEQVFALHPELRTEVDRQIDQYGRYL